VAHRGRRAPGFKVIVDNMMNLDLLFWGAQNGGDAAWTDMAANHALTTQRTHVRADGSTFQLVIFNSGTGAVISRGTVRGYRNDSTWARGQAWALHGFTQAYAYTGDNRMLTTARSAADYFIGHLPADGVPYWIAVLSPSGRGTLQIRDRFGGGRSETSSQGNLSTLPQTWATGQRWPDGPLSATGGP
jgi:hypothetical protein